MIAKLVASVVKIFKRRDPGVILQILAMKAGSAVMKEILDPENQKRAFVFVRELHLRTDLDSKMKAKVFNTMLRECLKKVGKEVSESAINCLRELAVVALKCESEVDWVEG